jgi:RNA polymerase primary sigma factor
VTDEPRAEAADPAASFSKLSPSRQRGVASGGSIRGVNGAETQVLEREHGPVPFEPSSHAPGRTVFDSHVAFVVKIAKEYRYLGVPFEDLLAEGNLGLLEAARRFDPARGARFTTYAAWWIRKYILQALRDQTFLVRIPDHRRRAFNAIDAPSMPRHVELSLDHRIDERMGSSLGEQLSDPSCACPEGETVQRDLEARLAAALRALSPPALRVLSDRFGLAGVDPLTLKEVGDKEGFSRERARQIECDALRRLRRELTRRPARRAHANSSAIPIASS